MSKKTSAIGAILNFSSREQPPLAALVDRINALEPPPKPAELIEAEAALAAAKERHAEAIARQREISSEYRAAVAASMPAPKIALVQAAVAEEKEAEAACTPLRKAVAEASLPWRQDFFSAISDEVKAARVELHGLITEIDAAMTAFAGLAERAARCNVGAFWIQREAPEIIAHLHVVKLRLEVDRQILPEERA